MSRPALLRPLVLAALLTPIAVGQVDRRGLSRTPTPPAANAPDGEFVQRASCVLQIDPGENNYRQVDAQLLTAMLTSTALTDPVAQSVLGLGPDDWQKAAQVEVAPAGQMAVRLNITVLPQAKAKANAARDLLAGLAAAAKTSFEQAGTRQDRAAAERRASLETQLSEAQQRLDAATAALNAAGRRSNTTLNQDVYDRRNAAAERGGLEVNLAAQAARLKAIEAEIAELPPSTQPGLPSENPELRQRLVGERVSLRINVAEARARLDAVTARAATSPASQPAPVDYDRLQSDQSTARQQVQEIRNQLNEYPRLSRRGTTARLIIMDGRKED